MSEEVSSESQATETPTETQSPGTSSLLSGNAATPFDSFYEEGQVAQSVPDGAFKNFLGKYDSGQKALEGFSNLNKLASSKGFARPGEDASDEEKAAFSAKLAELNGVPKEASDYSFELPEGAEMSDEVKQMVVDFGMENGIPPKMMESLLPLQIAAASKANEQAAQKYVEAQIAQIDELFGGAEARMKAEDGLVAFLAENGHGMTGPGPVDGVKMPTHADFYKLANDFMQAKQRIAQLTGEDISVKGGVVGHNTAKQVQEELDKFKTSSDPEYAVFRDPTKGTREQYAAAKEKFQSLTRQLVSRR